MRFLPDGNRFHEIFFVQRRDGIEQTFPATVPIGHEAIPGGEVVDEFVVTVPVGFFAIRGEKIGEARNHVAGHVLHDDDDAV